MLFPIFEWGGKREKVWRGATLCWDECADSHDVGEHGTRVEAGSLRRISDNDDRKVRDCVFKEENNIESWQNTRNIKER